MTHLLCLGDSITDCGRLFSSDPLGNGYVKQLSGLLQDAGRHFSIDNKGIDGLTLERLLHNTDSWLNTSAPDIITVLIGINDIGIMMNTRRNPRQQQILMNEFSVHYDLLARKLYGTRFSSCRMRKLFFLEPFVLPWPQYYNSWMPLLSQMSAQIRQISRKYGAVFVPLQNDLMQKAALSGMDAITVDGIHLTLSGHQLLAEKLYSLLTER